MPTQNADMAELADALDLGSSVNRRAGSTPVIRIVAKSSILSGFFAFRQTMAASLDEF